MHILSTLYDCQPADERPPLFVCQFHRFPIGDPQVNTTATRIDPKKVLVAELVAYGFVQDAHRCSDEDPAAFADVCAGATRSDGVIVSHIDIKDKFSQLWSECCWTDSLLVTRL